MIVINEQHDVIFYLNRKDFSAVLEFIEIFEEVGFEKKILPGELEVFWEEVGDILHN